jgi:hypothetical protein
MPQATESSSQMTARGDDPMPTFREMDEKTTLVCTDRAHQRGLLLYLFEPSMARSKFPINLGDPNRRRCFTERGRSTAYRTARNTVQTRGHSHSTAHSSRVREPLASGRRPRAAPASDLRSRKPTPSHESRRSGKARRNRRRRSPRRPPWPMTP